MVGRAARMHANDDDAATVDAKWREALHVLHAEPAAYDTALAHDLFQHIAGGGQRDGEADAVGVGHALGEHCGIDADQMAQGVDQCTRSEEHTSELKSLMRISNAAFCLQK